jgi:hypothetical protein
MAKGTTVLLCPGGGAKVGMDRSERGDNNAREGVGLSGAVDELLLLWVTNKSSTSFNARMRSSCKRFNCLLNVVMVTIVRGRVSSWVFMGINNQGVSMYQLGLCQLHWTQGFGVLG